MTRPNQLLSPPSDGTTNLGSRGVLPRKETPVQLRSHPSDGTINFGSRDALPRRETPGQCDVLVGLSGTRWILWCLTKNALCELDCE